jgi:SlyX protein
LNQLVYRQQKKIDELEELCTALAMRLKETAANAREQASANEKPPHY